MNNPHDCRSESGITIGLIDGMIAIARVLSKRDLENPGVKEALQDLQADEDISFLLNHNQGVNNGSN